MDVTVLKKTQDMLGKVIETPLTEKLLSRPPIQYLQDVFSEVIRGTGFLKGLYEESELKSGTVKDKHSKMAFFQKTIDVVMLVTGEPLAVKPACIVAEQEPEKTNELLQAIAKCCLNKMSSDEAVKQVLSGDKLDMKTKASNPKSHDKENREGRESHTDGEETKKIPECSGSRDQKDPDQPKEQVRCRRDGDKAHHRDRDQSHKHQCSEQNHPSKSRDWERDKDQGEGKKDKDRDIDRDKRRERARDAHRDRKPSVPSDMVSRSRPIWRPSSAHPASPRVKRQESYNTTPAERLSSAKLSTQIIMDGKKLSEDEEDDEQFPVQEAAPSTSVAPEIQAEPGKEQDSEETQGGLVQKILETKIEHESSAWSPQAKAQNLVSEVAPTKEPDVVTSEIELLCSAIQMVCQSSSSLEKVIDNSEEDMEAMQAEVQLWQEENKNHTQALLQEHRETERVMEPLKAELAELEQLIKDQQDKNFAVKARILKNEEKIQKMVTGINSSYRN